MSSNLPVRRTAHQREERRIRIMAQVRAGFSYGVIARDENLSRERVRQIVSQSLKDDKGADRWDHTRLQIARLEPALRLAARGIENGKLSAIGHMLKVLDRLDKYGSVVQSRDDDAKITRERLFRKLNIGLDKIRARNPAAVDEAEEAKDLQKVDSDPRDL
jgi:hypothetical protein